MRSAIGNAEPDSAMPFHFYCSSGGNAGIACATAAKSMNLPVTVVVPTATSALMVTKLRNLGANIHQVGDNWKDADCYLKSNLLDKNPNGIYIPPFDNPIIWEGASSLLEEVYEQMEDEGGFDGVVCSVGGGSLLTGIMTAIQGHSKDFPYRRVPRVLAVETRGADSLNTSLTEGRHITLPRITSIATSLGIVRVAERAYELAKQRNVDSIVLSDAEAAMGSVRFAEDEDILVEVSCGVSLAAIYNGRLRSVMGRGISDEAWKKMKVVVAVCGGSDVTPSLLESYQQKYCAQAPSMMKRTEIQKICFDISTGQSPASNFGARGAREKILREAIYL
jgi:L-serine/L-threonine ammonia-lyase